MSMYTLKPLTAEQASDLGAMVSLALSIVNGSEDLAKLAAEALGTVPLLKLQILTRLVLDIAEPALEECAGRSPAPGSKVTDWKN